MNRKEDRDQNSGVYRIGRHFYQEISIKEYCKLHEDDDTNIATLIDHGGDPIKYFRVVRRRVKNED